MLNGIEECWAGTSRQGIDRYAVDDVHLMRLIGRDELVSGCTTQTRLGVIKAMKLPLAN